MPLYDLYLADFAEAVQSFHDYEAALMASFGNSNSEQRGLTGTFMWPGTDRKWNAVGRRFRTWCYLVGRKDLPEKCKEMPAIEAYNYSAENGLLEDYRNLDIGIMAGMGRDLELHPALQDLGWMIGWDATQAAGALDDPDVYYPGVDEDIEPIDDEHVKLVIWATQRELNRELRGGGWGIPRRPAVPMAELPFRVQRAFVERRRLRYQQWGISPETWKTGKWHLLGVPEDSDWSPPWLS